MASYTLFGEFASSSQEKRFTLATWPGQALRMRFVCGLTSLLYLAAAIANYLNLGSSPAFTTLLVLRVACCALGLGNAALTFSKRSISFFHWTLCAYMLSIGVTESIEVALIWNIVQENYILFTLLIFFSFYMFLPHRLPHTILAAVTSSIVYLGSLMFCTGAAADTLLTAALFLLLFNGFGIYFLRSNNLSRRREFHALREERLLNRKLRQEIAARRRAQAQLQLLATTDDLTGTFNRRHFLHLCDQEMARLRRYAQPLSILLLDIDHFKYINDTFGHASGDKVLQELATRCTDHLRATDILGRLGGEEFGILLPATNIDAAVVVAQKLCAIMSAKHFAISPSHSVTITVSIGAAEAEPDEFASETLLRRADQALYTAKNNGRNRVCCASVSVVPPA